MENKQPTLRARFGGLFLELIMMFLGVYAAFTMENFRESQSNREKERTYLTSIRDELKTAMGVYARRDSHYTRKIARMDVLLMKMQNPATSIDTLQQYLTHYVFNFVIGDDVIIAYESMKSSGDLKLIRDKKLLFALGSYEKSIKSVGGQGDILFRFLDKFYANLFYPAYDFEKQRMNNTALFSDKIFRSQLVLCMLETTSYANEVKEHLGKTKRMLNQVEHALKE